MSVDVTPGRDSLSLGEVHKTGIQASMARNIPYDISPDGKRILAITSPQRATTTPLTLVTNWTELLKK